MLSYSITKSRKLTNTSRDHNSPSILHTAVPRHSVHAQNRSPPQSRPTSPRRRISRTRTRASQCPRPPTSTRRSPASKRTRARPADGAAPRRLEAACSDAIDSAAPIDRRCPPLAAPRCGRTFGMSRKRPAHMGARIPAQIERENIIRSSTRVPFKHPQQQKWGTRGKGGGAGHHAHHRNAQRGRVVRNARARGRGSRSQRSVAFSWQRLSSATCGTFHGSCSHE